MKARAPLDPSPRGMKHQAWRSTGVCVCVCAGLPLTLPGCVAYLGVAVLALAPLLARDPRSRFELDEATRGPLLVSQPGRQCDTQRGLEQTAG
jgi:hypothetical protein